jgi:hypothetical protein
MRRLSLPLALLLLTGPARAQDKITLTITIKAGKHDRRDTPLVVPLSVPKALGEEGHAVFKKGENTVVVSGGQLTAPGLTTEHIKPSKDGEVRRDLHLHLPRLDAGKSVVVQCVVEEGGSKIIPSFFSWARHKDAHTDLLFEGGKPQRSLRYMHAPYDDSSAEKRNRSYKVFHHLYDRQSGVQVTDGGHTDDLPQGVKLQYPHHRGLYFGFNRVSWDQGKSKADVWHCQKDDHISHEKVLSEEAGAALGRHRLLLHWHGPQKQVFAHEEREVTVYNISGGTLVEWSTLVRTKVGPVKLDGDPQHAGFHFRAANEVASREKETYFLRPDGKGELGATRNWPAQKQHVNLPWNAMSFRIGDQRYTAVYLDRPSNPREARHSERAYGRFGCYFEYDLSDENPLKLNYRVWVQRGEIEKAQAERLHHDFVEPPTVEVKQN